MTPISDAEFVIIGGGAVGCGVAYGLARAGVTDILLFQLPGLFTNWAKLDSARDALKDEFAHRFEAKGFTILGWGDVGAGKQISGAQFTRP